MIDWFFTSFLSIILIMVSVSTYKLPVFNCSVTLLVHSLIIFVFNQTRQNSFCVALWNNVLPRRNTIISLSIYNPERSVLGGYIKIRHAVNAKEWIKLLSLKRKLNFIHSTENLNLYEQHWLAIYGVALLYTSGSVVVQYYIILV